MSMRLAITRMGRSGAALFGLALAFAASPTATAEGFLAMQAGGFFPWQGDSGYSLALQMLGSNHTGRSRWGAEFERRDFQTRIAGVPDVDVESYILRAMWQHHFRPDDLITPYIGLGLGVAISDVDDERVDFVSGRDVRGSTGAGLDGLFLLGLSVTPYDLDYLSFYAEGRIGFGVDVTGEHESSGTIVENLGGASANAGLRFRF
jgi:hypothetical protein